MLFAAWFETGLDQIWFVAVSTAAMLAWAIVVIRVVGLRSLSKMSSFDFVVTVALGSIVATVVATPTSLWNGAFAFAALLGLQATIAVLRARLGLGDVVDNAPLLLMDGPELLHDNMKRARVAESDVRAKLREANVTDTAQVLAVVLETTGDVSVLHGEGPLDRSLLDGVRRS